MKSQRVKNKKQTTAQAICDEIIKIIKQENKLPWQQDFFPLAPKNYISGRYYRGFLNKYFCSFILNKIKAELKIKNPCPDFLTYKQLLEFNEKHKTNFRITKKGYSTKIIFSKPYMSKLTEKEKDVYLNGGYIKNLHIDKETEEPMILTWTRQFSIVFPVDIIEDENGMHLPTCKTHNQDIEMIDRSAQEVIENYCNFSGVKINNTEPTSECFYSGEKDTVYITPVEQFTNTESYYRTLFHELGHSTGITNRLNRSCYKSYHEAIKERSREELVAEMTSMLLAMECNFESEKCVENSYAYISSWIEYIENNPNEVIIGMSQAQQASDYILLKNHSELSNDTLTLSREVKTY